MPSCATTGRRAVAADAVSPMSATADVAAAAGLRSPEDMAGERGGYAPWCGPAAVAHVTGLPYAEACDLLHRLAPERYRRGAEIVTAWWRDLLAALAAEGVPAEPMPDLPARGGPMLMHYARTLAPGWYLVRVTGHFLLLRVTGFGLAEVYDNRMAGVVPTGRAGHGRRRVTHAVRLPEGPRAPRGR